MASFVLGEASFNNILASFNNIFMYTCIEYI